VPRRQQDARHKRQAYQVIQKNPILRRVKRQLLLLMMMMNEMAEMKIMAMLLVSEVCVYACMHVWQCFYQYGTK